MILPVQRVPRYKLLLQGALCHMNNNYKISSVVVVFFRTDYLKHLPKDHLDVENAEGQQTHTKSCMYTPNTMTIYVAALTVISEVASHMNSVIADLVRE